MGAPVYQGRFDAPHAERLLWRAGFGPRPGEAQALAKRGLHAAVEHLTNPGPEKLVGPKPHDEKGRRLAPADAWGHDHCWWLDRMVRTSRPLVERMTLVWHDWFATSNDGVGNQGLMLKQNEMFREHALGSFADLLHAVTANPAMLLWLNGTDNTKDSPNENYGREMMELFTLGADRGAYTERDVREQARSLTGWTNRWSRGRGDYDFHYDASRHDDGVKHVFGHAGDFTWQAACTLCLQHPKHASFFVEKLWSYFIPTPPDAHTTAELVRLYRKGYAIKPVVQAILLHPQLYVGPRMVKGPTVLVAGLLRRIGAGITTTDWAWIGSIAGQQLFYPPNVAGWDETRWLDTASFRGRWIAVQRVLRDRHIDPSHATGRSGNPKAVLARALAFWRNPPLSPATHAVLLKFAEDSLRKDRDTPLVENALRQLIAVSPDLQTA